MTTENPHVEYEVNPLSVMNNDPQAYGKQNKNIEIAQEDQLNHTLAVWGHRLGCFPPSHKKKDLSSKKTTPYPLHHYLTFSKATHQHRAFLILLQNEYIPKNSNEALTIPYWKQAMTEELKALEAN